MKTAAEAKEPTKPTWIYRAEDQDSVERFAELEMMFDVIQEWANEKGSK